MKLSALLLYAAIPAAGLGIIAATVTAPLPEKVIEMPVVVERIVEVPGPERIVEVERVVEMPGLERIVEVERLVEVPGPERVVEVIVEVPVIRTELAPASEPEVLTAEISVSIPEPALPKPPPHDNRDGEKSPHGPK